MNGAEMLDADLMAGPIERVNGPQIDKSWTNVVWRIFDIHRTQANKQTLRQDLAKFWTRLGKILIIFVNFKGIILKVFDKAFNLDLPFWKWPNRERIIWPSGRLVTLSADPKQTMSTPLCYVNEPPSRFLSPFLTSNIWDFLSLDIST